jgi:hypothetical protein
MSPHDPPRLGIIIPYRDRAEHLAEFLDCVPRFFLEDAVNVGIKPRFLIVEQAPGLPFNRGGVLNVGFQQLAGDIDYLCLHDVDRMPLSADYRWPEGPTMIIRGGLPYADNAELMKQLLGSVVLAQARQFAKANGFANTYWGWGYEDVDLRERLLRHGFAHTHRDVSFRSLPHVDLGSNPHGSQSEMSKKNQAIFVSRWFDRRGEGWIRRPVMYAEWLRDGLSTLSYRTISPRCAVSHPAGETFVIEHMAVDFSPPATA